MIGLIRRKSHRGRKKTGRKINPKPYPVYSDFGEGDVIPSFIDPEFDDLAGAEEELLEQFKGRGSED